MLRSLHIENFTIVSTLDLDFSTGMTAFTGETGAGKSIMIDALMLALGGRAETSVIRPGAQKCDISACFYTDETSDPAHWLQSHDIHDGSGEIFLRRVLYPEGRSKAYINGHPFPLQKLKELSDLLVDLHGQHQHQTLLQHATHRKQLDQYAKHQTLVDNVYQAYRQVEVIKQALLDEDTGDLPTLTVLEQQVQELEAIAPVEGEMLALHEEHQLLHHAQDYLEHAARITDLLQGEENPSLCQGLQQLLQCLSACPSTHPQIKNTEELLNSALIQCEEAVNELNHFSSQVSLDPERLEVVEARISVLHQAARKHHVEASQLPTQLEILQTTLKTLKQKNEDRHQLALAYQQHLDAYQVAARDLSASRQKYALLLARDITTSIQQLGMPKGFLNITLTPLDTPHPHGLDKVEYTVCTNPGMEADLLSKIASGGELSRIGLAIHVITAQRGATPTLLFDEVDVGIGGATAALVGQLLRSLGERLQVFCVTHQPQVAAAADHHFRVEKQSDMHHTFSTVTPLQDDQKINEIARMLGGLCITEQTRSHAKELLMQSRDSILATI